MISLSKRDIRQGYAGVRAIAEKYVKRGDYINALRYISHCSSIAGQFNWIYSDSKIESMMQIISEKTILRCCNEYESNINNWVLYDDWCTSYVLAVQWLEAMAKTGKNILYITSRDFTKANKSPSILDRANAFRNVQVHIVPSGNEIDRAQHIFDTITDFKASKLILHKGAVSSPVNLVLYALPKGITRYLINLSDQTFWIGAKAIDYCIEFRNFGASVSLQRRGLKLEQLLMVPFYPADDCNPFGGFPKECSDEKIVIFSGGDYYKTLNKNRTYWTLVKTLLEKYPQIVFLFATKNIPEGDSEIYQFISDNHFEGRFIYIQFRPDIYQVFAHCDIFMGTSPTSGSLMTGLACVNAKPILQYYEPGTTDDETEQSVCYNERYKISFTDTESFLSEADKLINDKYYRAVQGEKLQNAIISQEQFDELVEKTIETNITHRDIIEIDVNYKELENRWFFLETNHYIDTLSYVYNLLGKCKGFFAAPAILIKKNANRIFAYLKRI